MRITVKFILLNQKSNESRNKEDKWGKTEKNDKQICTATITTNMHKQYV